jgi:hypothetical protein
MNVGGGYGPAREALDAERAETLERLAGLERELAGIVEAADSASGAAGNGEMAKWRQQAVTGVAWWKYRRQLGRPGGVRLATAAGGRRGCCRPGL